MAKTKGWICPKCSKVYAPTVTECYACNAVQAYKPIKWVYPYWPYYGWGTYTIKVGDNTATTSISDITDMGASGIKIRWEAK